MSFRRRAATAALVAAGAMPAPTGDEAIAAPATRAAAAFRGALLAVAAAAILAGPSGAPAQPAPLEGLDTFIERGMAEWGIPGLSISVVKDDRLVFARGYGVLRKGEAARVDERTIFGVASVSKAFTAGALAMLVDEGRLSWDDPVVKHLPAFRLYDAYVTEHTTVRDLLSHRVGVGRMTGNRLRWLPSRPRAELIHRMRFLDPERPFRDGYVYSNVMYMTAGELIPAITGQSWDAFVTERILRPLGMARSSASYAGLRAATNAAQPHQEIEGDVVPIPVRDFDAVGPAASINASAAEIAAWMRVHLGTPGEADGVRLFSEEAVREMHRAQVALPDAGLTGGLAAYGLGWRLSEYEGRRVSQHGGATDGMNSTLMLVPEENLGVFVSTNTFNSFMNALAHRVVDRFLGLPDRPWDRAYRDAYLSAFGTATAARDSIHGVRAAGTRPSLPLERYTGEYADSLYADARVTLEGGALVLRFWEDPDMVADLEHWHHDTFRAVWRNRAMREEFVRFTRGWDGGVDALRIEWVLRPMLLQVGAYPSGYTREAELRRVGPVEPVTATGDDS